MFQPFNIKCDLCGRGKFKSQSGLTRHRDACQQKRHSQNQHEQSSEEYAVINSTQFVESENSDHNEPALKKPNQNTFSKSTLQLLTDETYATARPEDNGFENITTENVNRDTSPEPMLFDGEAATGGQEPSVTSSRHTVAKTVSYAQATKRQAGAKLTLEEVEQELEVPLINKTATPSTERSEDIVRMEQAFAHWAVNGTESKSNIDRLLRNKDFISPLKKLGWKADNYDSLVASVYDMDVFEMKWTKWTLSYPEVTWNGVKGLTLDLYSQDIVDIVRFLIGHEPFADNLTYAPVHEFNSQDSRIYSQAHTADAWWNLQDKYPEGATIIPVQWMSDKTHVSQQRGDRYVHACYVSILNISKEVRRQTNRPATLPIALIPIIKDSDGINSEVFLDLKRRIYHDSMDVIFNALTKIGTKGIIFRCADGAYRRCYPVLAACSADYEEQCTITGIKHGRHCAKCLVPPDERFKLMGIWQERSRESTLDQLKLDKKRREEKATKENPKKKDPMALALMRNFAWKHPNVNIHHCLAIDLLHVFFSNGLVEYVLKWAVNLLVPETSSTMKKDKKTIQDLIDKRLQMCPSAPGFDKWTKSLFHLTQKTGNEWKSISKVLVAVIGPLLSQINRPAMLFVRAFVDFLTVTQYRSQDDETLGYLENYLEIMDICQEALAKARDSVKDSRMNFPKWHLLTHVIGSIKSFGTVDGTDTSTSEKLHTVWFKKWAHNTNFRGTWLDQLTRHLTIACKVQVQEDILAYKGIKARDDSNREAEITPFTTGITDAVRQIDDLELPEFEKIDLRLKKMFSRSLLHAQDIADWAGVPTFLEALAPFVRQCRYRYRNNELGGTVTVGAEDQKDSSTDWARTLKISVHSGIKYWAPDLNSSEPEAQIQQTARCRWNWQNMNEGWRRDYVWAQEHQYAPSNRHLAEEGLKGRLPVQLLLIFTVHDTDLGEISAYSRKKPEYPKYRGALVREFRPANGINYHETHGLVEFRAKENTSGWKLGSDRIYPIEALGPSVQLIPSTRSDLYFFNPYITHEAFNTLWDPVYFEDGRKMARRLLKEWKQNTRKRKLDIFRSS